MATIAKFYLLDAATTNTGTMPSGALITAGTNTATDGDAAGARTARATSDVAGTSNPDIESSLTANASTLLQQWGHRRFVSPPLAARTFDDNEGNWTFSYARSESNLNHNQAVRCTAYCWRPSTGARVGVASDSVTMTGTEPGSAGAQEAQSVTSVWNGNNSPTIADGDILVFDVTSVFQQGMATAYNEQFAYDGTTEGSTTTCASFVTPPIPLTLFTGTRVPRSPGVDSANAHLSKAWQAVRRWKHGAHGILVPDLEFVH